MTDWQQLYADRRMSAEQAVSVVQPGHRLVFSSYGAEPQTLIDALLATGKLQGTSGFQEIRATRGLLVNAQLATGFRLITYSPDARAASAIAEGRADFLPSSIHRVCRWAEDGTLAVDVAVIHVSPPDDAGYCSFGISTNFAAVVTPLAKMVIAQINDQMPRTRGDSLLHVSHIDRIVEVSQALPTTVRADIDEAAQAVARQVVDLVADGATLEVGVGSVPDAVLGQLSERRDLGVHSGLITDAMIPLVQAGVITGARKTIDRGLMIANQVTGTQQLYEFVGACPQVEMRLASYVHDPAVLAQLDNFIALNSAVQVDLRGQVNSEFLGGRQIAGTGGSIDFAIGATASRGGKSIIAMSATAGRGRHSRIVAQLPDAVVTIPQTLVDYVVTEFGVASLAGKTLSERASQLAAIAHPDFRAELHRQIRA
jgi:4-hydroxybutyrate CoA-transferase